MPNSPDKRIYHLCIPKEEKEKFDKMFPKLLSQFLNKAIKKANNDHSFFEQIFFER